MAKLFSYNELKRNYEGIVESIESLDLEGYKSADRISINPYDEFDIFLSHSYRDKEIIPYLKKELEDMGYSVYVDWITDKLLSREQVTKETAKVLQKRMKQSKFLFFATSENSPNSKWMPWELGYFDGIKNKRVAILPISKEENDFSENFKGQEYLGLYCWVVKDKKEYSSYEEKLFIKCDTYGIEKSIDEWYREV